MMPGMFTEKELAALNVLNVVINNNTRYSDNARHIKDVMQNVILLLRDEKRDELWLRDFLVSFCEYSGVKFGYGSQKMAHENHIKEFVKVFLENDAD